MREKKARQDKACHILEGVGDGGGGGGRERETRAILYIITSEISSLGRGGCQEKDEIVEVGCVLLAAGWC